MTDDHKSVTVTPVTKFLAILLLISLPLSWTTAAVAAYCKHESVASEQNHLGHHDDRDHSPSANPDPDNQDGTQKPHAHCSLSHVYYSAFPMSSADIGYLFIPSRLSWLPDSRPLISVLPDEPERPKWLIAV